jgi:hypothetical protein
MWKQSVKTSVFRPLFIKLFIMHKYDYFCHFVNTDIVDWTWAYDVKSDTIKPILTDFFNKYIIFLRQGEK